MQKQPETMKILSGTIKENAGMGGKVERLGMGQLQKPNPKPEAYNRKRAGQAREKDSGPSMLQDKEKL